MVDHMVYQVKLKEVQNDGRKYSMMSLNQIKPSFLMIYIEYGVVHIAHLIT